MKLVPMLPPPLPGPPLPDPVFSVQRSEIKGHGPDARVGMYPNPPFLPPRQFSWVASALWPAGMVAAIFD